MDILHALIIYGLQHKLKLGVNWNVLWSSLIKLCESIAKDHIRDKDKAGDLLRKVST